jgi:hypothetical protein
MDHVLRGGPPYGHSNHDRPCVRLEEAGLNSDSQNYVKTPQLNTEQGINLEMVYRSLLRIVARLDENEYTEGMLRQTTEVVLDDLADPASDTNTSQG